MSKIKENELVKKFSEYCSIKKIYKIIYIGKSNASKHMDCEFILNAKEYVRLEAKVFNDTRNKSQNALKIFGGILKGRKLELAKKTKLNIVYGILINASQETDALKRFKSINLDDWNNFGNIFEVKYVFILDENNKEICIKDWKNFIA